MTPDTPSEQSFFPLKILVVDDEANIRKTLSYCLSRLGHEVIAVESAEEAREEARHQTINLAYVDLRLGETSGLDLVPVLLTESPWMKVVVITAYASLETAVEAMKRGACDYIAKPFTADRITVLTGQISRICRLEHENEALKADIQDNQPELSWETANPAVMRVLSTLRKAAPSEAIILLHGESGTGKSVLARAVHAWSSRSSGPFGVISCPSVPSELLESELFGHTRGAFTGAVKDNPGRISVCEGGTLFLDEIGDMALGVQAKLLRFIQDKEYERLGESVSRKADVRILAATNADLSLLVEEGRFREDLYYRLNVISLTIPPLRERRGDIMPLAESFLRHFCRVNHKQGLAFAPDARDWVKTHSWPGNIRELRNCVERAVILSHGNLITLEDLSDKPVPSSGQLFSPGDPMTLAKLEELHIRRVLGRAGSLQEAASLLGIDQTTLWRKRKALGLL